MQTRPNLTNPVAAQPNQGRKIDQMADDAIKEPEKQIDWADLRAQAAKLGISLSEFQQRDREKKLRAAKKQQGRTPHPPPEPSAAPEQQSAPAPLPGDSGK